MAVLSLAVEDRVAARRIEFQVPGIPQPQGSTKSFHQPQTGKLVTISDNPKLRSWRLDARVVALEAMRDEEPLSGPVEVRISFRLLRPGYHFRAQGQLKASAPHFSSVRPDLDKLTRAVGDALKEAAVFRDDAQVARLTVEKIFGDPCGATVVIEEL